MVFNNQLMVIFNDNTWVVCRFIRSIGFYPFHGFGGHKCFTQKFVLEEVVGPSGETNNREVSGNCIVGIAPIHRVPLLITVSKSGVFYERITTDLCVQPRGLCGGFSSIYFPFLSIDSRNIDTRFLIHYYEREKDYYTDLISDDVESQFAPFLDRMVQASNDEPSSYVYSIEPFLTEYDIEDWRIKNAKKNQSYNSGRLYGDQHVKQINLVHDSCHKIICINTEIDTSYSTRNFDVEEVRHLHFEKRFPTRKVCQDYLDTKLESLQAAYDSEISLKGVSKDVINYLVTSPGGFNLSDMGLSAGDFTETVSSNSSWRW